MHLLKQMLLTAPNTSRTRTLVREVVFVEEWAFVDGRELVSFCGVQSCPSCSSFGYVSLGQCQVLGACQPKKRFLPPGAQLLRRCEHWSHATPWALVVSK